MKNKLKRIIFSLAIMVILCSCTIGTPQIFSIFDVSIQPNNNVQPFYMKFDVAYNDQNNVQHNFLFNATIVTFEPYFLAGYTIQP